MPTCWDFGTYSVTWFLRFLVRHFATLSEVKKIVRPLNFSEIFQNGAKLRGSTGGTIRTIIVAVCAKIKTIFKIFRSPIRRGWLFFLSYLNLRVKRSERSKCTVVKENNATKFFKIKKLDELVAVEVIIYHETGNESIFPFKILNIHSGMGRLKLAER